MYRPLWLNFTSEMEEIISEKKDLLLGSSGSSKTEKQYFRLLFRNWTNHFEVPAGPRPSLTLQEATAQASDLQALSGVPLLW